MKINSNSFKYLSKITNSIYEDIKIEFLYHSNHIEGSTFSKAELEKLLNEKKVEGLHSLDDIYETKNSLDLFDEVILDSDKELDKFMLFKWHRILKKSTVDEEIGNTGCWKKFENRLKNVDLKLAFPLEVDNKMFNLLLDFQEKENITVEDIADFHAKFEQIHPFQDGNGRIGRFIILHQCIENEIDLIAIDNVYEEEYKEALYKAQTTNDNEELINVFKKCQKRLDDKLKTYEDLLENVKDLTTSDNGEDAGNSDKSDDYEL